MATTTAASVLPVPADTQIPEQPGLTAHWRAIKVVTHRELLRVKSDRIRMISSLAQPFLFLFILGSGLRMGDAPGLDFKTFLFPGVLTMSVLFTAMFSSMSIVWDREFGFLREMLVAPVPRSAIIIGKALGGAMVASIQGVVVLSLAGFAGVPYDPGMLALLLVEIFTLSFAMCAFGLVLAARIQQMQAMMGVMNLAVMPLFFLSGSLYPLSNLPTVLQVIARFNPLTYAVTAMRHTVFSHVDMPEATRATFDLGITWFGWELPAALPVLVVAVLGVILLRIAIAELEGDV
jgi:ABC-2 type transport system permease protein